MPSLAAARPSVAPGTPRRRRRLVPRWLRWVVPGLVAATAALGVLLLVFAWDLPRPEAALAATRRPAATLLAADGSVIAASGDLYGEVVRLRDLPPHLPAALLAIEDRRFRHHIGIDLAAIIRAALANARAGGVVQGGSTLTQQLAKGLFLGPERTLRRKVQEALLALWLEQRFDKDALLEIYLNRVYLGAGAWGVDAAARLYFGVPARRLQTWQSALLAGLPKAPSRLNPRASPDLAAARASEVLDAMIETGTLTPAEAWAERGRIRLTGAPPRVGGAFADWVLEGLPARFPGNDDLVLRTTLDRRLQAVAEARLAAVLAGPGARAGVTQGALVAMEASNGAVRAMVGGAGGGPGAFNRAVDARRQPGSAFKPIVFLAALEAGMDMTEGLSDGPIALRGWSPGNGAWRSRGEVSAEDALAYSVNTSAVRALLRAGGPEAVIAVARRLRLGSAFPADASLALGTGETRLLDLVAAYGAIAAGGWRPEPYGVAAATVAGVRMPALAVAGSTRVMAPEHAAALSSALAAAVTRGTGRGAALPGRAVAGKTGTTQDGRDAWFVGWVGGGERALVIGVWLGDDAGRPTEERGGGLPAQVFREVAAAW